MFSFYQLLSQAPPSLRDIKPPLEPQQSLFPYFVAGGILVVIIAMLVWFYLQQRRQTSAPTSTEEVEVCPPHEIAYERLAAIEASEWLARGELDAYHTQISRVIREYIEVRYRIPALELTTTQLLAQLTEGQLGALYVDKIRHFLVNCDKVKFATYQPATAEAAKRMIEARWFIDVTRIPV